MSGLAWKIRVLALGNVLVIPYVAIQFPRELVGYLRRVGRGLAFGRSDLPAKFGR